LGHGRGRLEPFSDSIATGLGWLFSVLGAAPSLGGASPLDASLAWPQRALVVVGIVLAVF